MNRISKSSDSLPRALGKNSKWIENISSCKKCKVCELNPQKIYPNLSYHGRYGTTTDFIFVVGGPLEPDTLTFRSGGGDVFSIIREIMIEADLGERNFIVTNVTFCGNFTGKDRASIIPPSKEMINNCKDNLFGVLNTLPKAHKIAMGKVAARTLKDISKETTMFRYAEVMDPIAILLSKHQELEVKRAALTIQQFVNAH